MSAAARPRREPVQARSRETVTRVLDAAAALINQGGVAGLIKALDEKNRQLAAGKSG